MKIDRLLAITVLLLNRNRVTAQELAERFEVSTKTIYRDMDTLSRAGIPVEALPGSSGGFRIMEQYTLDRQMVSAREKQDLLSVVTGMQHAFDDPDSARLAEKIRALISPAEQAGGRIGFRESELVIDYLPFGQDHSSRDKLIRLRQAIRERFYVRAVYTNSEGQENIRILEPVSLILKGSVWYLQAYCQLRQEFRVFRLSRITELTLLEEQFVSRKIPNLQGYAWDPEWLKEVQIDIRMTFKHEVRTRVGDTFPQQFLTVNPDRSVTVEGTFAMNEWFYGMLLSFGSHVLIESPPSLAHELRRRAEQIVNLYH